MSWRVARSLDRLLEQINDTAPSRSKRSDGSIGDAAHRSRSSDHNPWVRYGGLGIVTARDFTHDPPRFDAHAFANRLRLACQSGAERRVKYIISAGRIASTQRGWAWRNYTGPNPHNSHVHVSVSPSPSRFDDTSSWAAALGGGAFDGYDPPGPPPPPPAPEPEPLEWYEMTEIPTEAQQTIRHLAKLAAAEALAEALPTIVGAVGREMDRYYRGTVQASERAIVDASVSTAISSVFGAMGGRPAEFVDLIATKAASAVWSSQRPHPNLPGVVTTQSAVVGSTYRALTKTASAGGLMSAEQGSAIAAEVDADLTAAED